MRLTRGAMGVSLPAPPLPIPGAFSASLGVVRRGSADTEHPCSAPHPPPGTPSRQRTRPGVCLFYLADFPVLRAKAAAEWAGSSAPAGGTRFSVPFAAGKGVFAPSPDAPGRTGTPRSPFRGLSGLEGREMQTVTVQVSPRMQFPGSWGGECRESGARNCLAITVVSHLGAYRSSHQTPHASFLFH